MRGDDLLIGRGVWFVAPGEPCGRRVGSKLASDTTTERTFVGYVEETVTIDAPPAAVWALAGDPARIGEWVPALAGASVEGDERTCTTTDGATVRERILTHDDQAQFYEYEIVDGPLPVRGYRSRLVVTGHGGHTHVTWAAEFLPAADSSEDEVVAMIKALYRQGLVGLRERVEATAAA